MVTEIEYTTQLNNGAGKLTFSYLKQGIQFPSGSLVRFRWNEDKTFYGYIFKSSNSDGDVISATAYDQLRYLKYKDSLMIKAMTVGKLLKTICEKRQLKAGNVEDTKLPLPSRIVRNKTYLDMVYEGIDETLVSAKKKYVLYDNFGSLDLIEAEKLKLPLIIGDMSLAYGYEYERSIDGDTYNTIKLAQKKTDSDGNTYLDQTFVMEDKKTQAKWGILQYYEEVDDSMSKERIQARAKELLSLYNQEERMLNIPCIGDIRVKGGSGVRVVLSNLMIDQWFIVKGVTHTFLPIHTMEVELVIL